MALSDYLKGIADAIRAKKGSTALINAQTFADEIRNLPSGEGGGGEVTIIDMEQFPPYEKVSMIENGEPVKTIAGYGIKINVVDVLPETGDAFRGSLDLTFYLQKSTMTAHAYVTGNKPGWTTAYGALVGLSNLLVFGGVVTDKADATEADRYYIWYDSVQYINENAIYRIPKYVTEYTAYFYQNGAKVTNLNNGNTAVSIIVVDGLPSVGEKYLSDDLTKGVVYYNTEDNLVYIYYENWSFADAFLKGAGGGTYGGVINSTDEATDTSALYLVYEGVNTLLGDYLYYYQEGWKGIGTHIAIEGAVPVIGTWDTLGAPSVVDTTNIYFNVNMSVEDVVDVLSSLVYSNAFVFESAILAVYAGNVSTNTGALVIIINVNGEYAILDFATNTLYFESVANVMADYGFSADFVGWNPDLVSSGGVIEGDFGIAVEGTDLGMGMIVDNQQELYASIISKTPNFGSGETIPLSGAFKTTSVSTVDNGTIDLQPYIDKQQLVTEVVIDVKRVTKDYTNNTITSIPDKMFQDFDVFKSVNCPNITWIGSNAFDGCTGLESILFPTTLTIIEMYAFQGCGSLESITIPASVTRIETDAFNQCVKLKNITVLATTPFYLGNDAFHLISPDAVITVPAGCGEAYKSAKNWSEYADMIVEATE